MKNPLYTVILLGLSVVAANTLTAEAQKQARLPIADDTNIVVHYTESVRPSSMGGIYPDGASNDRRSSFSRVLKEAFTEAGLPVDVEVVRLGSRKSGDLDITVNISTWELNSMGEYECRFSATISNGEEKIDLGVFIGTFNELTIHRGSDPKFTYDVAARKAVDKMVSLFIRA
ncbi:MAG: hypothetical protein DRP71_00045 [Verrucomicrobia bacterium]|nr:MAG: hypothetical protein DRP71_00045 [Verrucomicrobiota bacterium]